MNHLPFSLWMASINESFKNLVYLIKGLSLTIVCCFSQNRVENEMDKFQIFDYDWIGSNASSVK